MSFNEQTAAAQDFSENAELFGEVFTYQNTALVGVFNQVELDYRFSEFSVRQVTALVCVTSKPQWETAGLTPANRQVIVYGGTSYPIQKIDGVGTEAEPAFTLTCFQLT